MHDRVMRLRLHEYRLDLARRSQSHRLHTGRHRVPSDDHPALARNGEGKDVLTRLLQILEDDPDEWRDYMALIAQINNSPEWGGELMTRYFDPLVRRFLDALRNAIPDCDEEDLFWSYHFLSGALTLTFAETGRLDNLSDGLCKSSDIAAANARMARFVAGGFEALCRRKS